MTEYLQVLILGIVQGATEWLPVSSEGMLTLIQLQFFGKELDKALTLAIWLHLGTLLSAVVYFRKELIHLVPKDPSVGYLGRRRWRRMIVSSLIFFLSQHLRQELLVFLYCGSVWSWSLSAMFRQPLLACC